MVTNRGAAMADRSPGLWRAPALIALLVSRVALAAAPTTGTLQGVVMVVTPAGVRGLAGGIVVTARGPSLAGELSARTDSDGRYQIPLLPPGEYAVRAARSGQGAADEVERRGVFVGA